MVILHLCRRGHGVGCHLHHRFFLVHFGPHPLQRRDRGHERQWCFYCCKTGCRWEENRIISRHKKPGHLLFLLNVRAFLCMSFFGRTNFMLCIIPNNTKSSVNDGSPYSTFSSYTQGVKFIYVI